MLLKILVGIFGYLGEVVVSFVRAFRSSFWSWLLNLEPILSTRHKYFIPAFVLAFMLIPVTEILWVYLGGEWKGFLWNSFPFILLYWGTVAIGAVIVGIPLGFLELARNKG
jgi:hypothetical protein